MEPIATIRTDFKEKFGIPRQSGIADKLEAQIIFEPKYRQPEAFRGLEEFSHIWLLWQFDHALRPGFSATVKPPRLGGKKRMGVFATRSPFRPNPIGLSCVKLDRIEFSETQGPILHVKGADLLDRTPIYDIKPYLPYADCHPDATGGFTAEIDMPKLEVTFPADLAVYFPENKKEALLQILAEDPRPAFKRKENGSYAIHFGGFDVHFTIEGNKLRITDAVPD